MAIGAVPQPARVSCPPEPLGGTRTPGPAPRPMHGGAVNDPTPALSWEAAEDVCDLVWRWVGAAGVLAITLHGAGGGVPRQPYHAPDEDGTVLLAYVSHPVTGQRVGQLRYRPSPDDPVAGRDPGE